MPNPEKPEKKDKRPRKSLEYWKRRAEARMYEEMEKAEGSADTVSRVYAMAARYLMDKADQVFDRYQTTEKLSEAEAVQMLNSMDNIEDMTELERKLTEDGSEEAMRSLERLKNTDSSDGDAKDDSENEKDSGIKVYCENSCKNGVYLEKGEMFLDMLLAK